MTKKTNKGKKYNKPVHLPYSFDEAMRRIIRVSKDDLDEQEAKEKRKSGKSKKDKKNDCGE